MLDTILPQITYYAEQQKDSLLTIDDYEAYRRHECLSIYMYVQTYYSIPLFNRRTINYLVLFKMKNKTEKKSF